MRSFIQRKYSTGYTFWPARTLIQRKFDISLLTLANKVPRVRHHTLISSPTPFNPTRLWIPLICSLSTQHLPPNSSSSTKVTLPPRPTAATQPSRLAMPFASLLCAKPKSTTTPPTVAVPLPPIQMPLIPPPEDHPILISAFSIARAVYRYDVIQDVLAALKSELLLTLETAGVLAMIVEHVHSFASPLLPFVGGPAGKKKLHDICASPKLVQKFQEFYLELEGEVRIEIEKETGEASEEEQESMFKELVEVVEVTMIGVLLLPSHSDDASHNEALSSHIAALSLLDLGLEHLDVDSERVEKLSQLEVAGKSPGDKAAVLVAARKLIVGEDGLSHLPPIKLSNGDKQPEEPAPQRKRVHRQDHLLLLPMRYPYPIRNPMGMQLTGTIFDYNVLPLPHPTPRFLAPNDHLLCPTADDSIRRYPSPTSHIRVVKSSPAHLVSHLLFTQRYRNAAFAGGEERYYMINLMTVVEFLKNVDLDALGVGEGVGIVRWVFQLLDHSHQLFACLKPLFLYRRPDPNPNRAHYTSTRCACKRTRQSPRTRRTRQGVDAIVGSAISGVIDSSFESSDARWNMGPLRRECGFSIASLVRGREGDGVDDGQRELVEVASCPSSIPAIYVNEDGGVGGTEDESEESGEDEEEESEGEEHAHDARSIQSLESVMGGNSGKA
ncbi:hypothetical protein BDR05DRAFT_999692 [Suillus weaverae]|nr:hypothetical protein BDR05DRAFT_999692 [Suillus weaverae]